MFLKAVEVPGEILGHGGIEVDGMVGEIEMGIGPLFSFIDGLERESLEGFVLGGVCPVGDVASEDCVVVDEVIG